MELRSCAYWHFIQSLSGGLVLKSLNINRGRPALKFKELKEIYGEGNENYQNPNDEFEGFLSYGKRIAVERPIMSDSVDSEASYSDDDKYDLVSDKITLKQIREICKVKKRKRSNLVNSWTEETLVSLKEEIVEDDCDLTEPLILWKTKASKETKGRIKSTKKCVSMSRQSVSSSIVKVETIPSDLDFGMSTESLLSIVKVKEEASEITCSDSLNPIGKSLLIWDDRAQVDSCVDGHKAIEAENICTELGMENQASVSDNKNKQHGDVHMKNAESGSSMISDDQPYSNTVTLIAPTEEPQLSVINETYNEGKIITEFLPETKEKLASWIQENTICTLNEMCHDYMGQQASPEPGCLTTADLEIKEDDVADKKDDQHSDFFPRESGVKIDFTESQCGTTTNDFPCEPKVQSLESDLGSDSCAEEDLLCHEEYSSDLECNFILSPEDSPLTETKQSQSCSSSAVAGDSLAQILDSDACEELNTCPPQRLLSTRKAISPDSQEKLCKAMESINISKLFSFQAISLDSRDIQDKEHYRRRKKPYSGPRDGIEIEANKPDKTCLITKIKFSVPQKQNSLKPKHEKRNNQTNPVSDGSHSSSPSQKVPRFTSGCNSIESCSQSAIAFSQRQMQDIECLALKLTNELRSMKEIAEDRLFSESSISPSLKYRPSEVRMAIKRAAKVEKLANKWLSMMSRDCNRFCKIMTLAEKDSESPQKAGVANNERKKIIFADEAGEELCSVKFFEKNVTESFETDSEESNKVLT